MYIEVSFPIAGTAQQEILSALLMSFGFETVEEAEGCVKGYIPQQQWNENELKELLKETTDFKNLSFTSQPLPDQNWNEQWEKSYQPIVIDGKIRIRASFHPVDNNVMYELLIDPKMSFGTGHHATTQLMLEIMLGMDFTEKSVLDIGSGTGVLSIFAEKAGAKSIVAIDIDEWAYNNIVENIELNGAVKVTPLLGGAEVIPAEQFDIILANINKNIILEYLPLLSKRVKPQGTVLLSGLLEADESDIVKAATAFGLVLQEKKSLGDWICLKMQQK